ncbi:N-acetylmuramoyl-L-alanine amidase [Thiohalomonas denitrificans]|uniref:N-acetylmuramoyl-L-alanine amidase AmiC n=1 Tax=Thiohalomonas denitrificans TaxID=415747 RepID=A0A1G5PKF5_9GAMM|nr:N-acetylmuramoyl-L-alanine amidase [Thiohalomonas denitrificans]SCZ49846.1 N-acetylmuramoyl-L-alanine amidase [Thiohalomonas denitrificans]
MRWFKVLCTFVLLLFGTSGFAQERIDGLRAWPAPDHTRLVFDLSGPVKHKLFTLSNPERVVIDIEDAALTTSLKDRDFGKLLKGIRSGIRNETDLRVVLDLDEETRPKSFALSPNDQYGHRLVIDLEKSGGSSPVRRLNQVARAREVLVAIDAGHGGEDPGASGPSGVREKSVVLAIARKLASLINKEPGMRAILTRDGDYYLSLLKRVEKARQANADLFVSIHADAFRDSRVKGASVFILSNNGASSEHARLLAHKENSSDLIGGVSLDGKDNLLASVLLDLSQTASNEASYHVAEQVLRDIKQVGKIHKRKVERAAFRVLKAPDIPSLLIETAFISNPSDERALVSPDHQYKMARAIKNGIHNYFQQYPPPGTLMAERQTHVIARGDTLSEIARQYRVSADAIRSFNGLSNNTIRVGQVLQIPGGG